MQEYLNRFHSVIREKIQDPQFKLLLSSGWGAEKENYRIKIREHMATVDSSYFNKLQWAELYNLNQRPRAQDGFVSVSHSPSVGGYSYSKFVSGFDVEDVRRISDPVIYRTSSDEERSKVPHIKMLWVAKEAAFKAQSDLDATLLITDLTCQKWTESNELHIWSYQISSFKKLDFEHNIGFVMSTPLLMLAVYFR